MTQRILAMAWLTCKAAIRFRLVWVLGALLVAAVVLLPLLVKDDGTARGFTQILLTYTLSSITGLLGLATLWLACGTLARDIEECQIQVVAVKPIARWEIWVGKWLGIMFLNAALVGVAGAAVYSLLHYRAAKLPEHQQRILQNEVLVARASLREPVPDFRAEARRIVAEYRRDNPLTPLDEQLWLKQVEEGLKSRDQVVPQNFQRVWNFDLGWTAQRISDQPLYLRFKFYVAQTNAAGTYATTIVAGPPHDPAKWRRDINLAGSTFHEIPVPPGLFDEKGAIQIGVRNYSETSFLFPVEEGLELLYRDGTFALNFARGLGIILCWLGLMAALGLAAASFLSFPVAAFLSLALMTVVFSSNTMSVVVEEGTVMGLNHETGQAYGRSILDLILIPIFSALLKLIQLVQGFSPIEHLSTGRSIGWWELGRAIGQIVLLLGGMFAAVGIGLFTRRELATAQGVN
jgi:hypothetical protein